MLMLIVQETVTIVLQETVRLVPLFVLETVMSVQVQGRHIIVQLIIHFVQIQMLLVIVLVQALLLIVNLVVNVGIVPHIRVI